MLRVVLILSAFLVLASAEAHHRGRYATRRQSQFKWRYPVRRYLRQRPPQPLYYDDFADFYGTSTAAPPQVLDFVPAPLQPESPSRTNDIEGSDEELESLLSLAEVLDLGLGSNNQVENSIPTVLPNNVIDVASEKGRFMTFVNLATNLNLAQSLREAPRVTLFIPSDNVFNGLQRFSVSADDLKRHAIAVKLSSDAIETGPAFTMSGEVINLIKSPNGQVQIEYNGKTVNIVETDLDASNGVIHVIDGIIA